MSEASEVVRINSVSIEDNSRGTTCSVKAYGLTMQEAEDEAVASIERLRARLGALAQLHGAGPNLLNALKQFVDDEDCRFDHNGYCQEHGVTKPCRNTLAILAIAQAEGRDL